MPGGIEPGGGGLNPGGDLPNVNDINNDIGPWIVKNGTVSGTAGVSMNTRLVTVALKQQALGDARYDDNYAIVPGTKLLHYCPDIEPEGSGD